MEHGGAVQFVQCAANRPPGDAQVTEAWRGERMSGMMLPCVQGLTGARQMVCKAHNLSAYLPGRLGEVQRCRDGFMAALDDPLRKFRSHSRDGRHRKPSQKDDAAAERNRTCSLQAWPWDATVRTFGRLR